jgi:hypothetical protein
MSVSNIIMLQNYVRNDEHQSQASEKEILEPWGQNHWAT